MFSPVASIHGTELLERAIMAGEKPGQLFSIGSLAKGALRDYTAAGSSRRTQNELDQVFRRWDSLIRLEAKVA